MKKIVLLSGILIWTFNLSAQIGFTTGSQFMRAPQWKNDLKKEFKVNSNSIFTATSYFSVDFTTRRKQKRIQIRPELHLARYQAEFFFDEMIDFDESDNYWIVFLGFDLNLDIYLSKLSRSVELSGNFGLADWLKNHLFIRVAPGVQFVHQNISGGSFFFDPLSSFFPGSIRKSRLVASTRLGIGVDWEVIKKLRLSPLLLYSIAPKVTWDSLGIPGPLINFDPNTPPPFQNPKPSKSAVHHFLIGLRFEYQLRK